MNILITGGTGFIGRHLCQRFTLENHLIFVLSRDIKKARSILGSNTTCFQSFDDIPLDIMFDVIVNLAGENIADKKWSKDRKKELESSRIDLTADLVAFIKRSKHKPECLISGSAIGYYGDGGDNILTEHSDAHDEYSYRLCAAWESQALRAKARGVRVCILRTGLVIGKNGGFLKKMLPSFKWGLGARLADGQQWMSWIHIHDFTNIVSFLIENQEQSGIFNAAAPAPVTNKQFTKTLADVLNRPAFLVLSVSILEKMFGEMSRLLTTGQRVIPKKLLDAKFEFIYSDLKSALLNVCGK